MRLATAGDGRLAVVLQSPAKNSAGDVQLAITTVPLPADGGDGGRGRGRGSGSINGGMSGTEEVWVAGGSEAVVLAELAKRGLAPLPAPPDDAQLRAAVPAALWNGEAVSGLLRRACAAGATGRGACAVRGIHPANQVWCAPNRAGVPAELPPAASLPRAVLGRLPDPGCQGQVVLHQRCSLPCAQQ